MPSRWIGISVARGVGLAVFLSVLFSANTFAERRELDPRPNQADAFARPDFVPHPTDNLPNPDKIALGERLFNDPRLSADGTISCARCHDPQLAFVDGETTGQGVSGRRLKRHTPALWNLAWAPTLFWDGRAASLEHQAKGSIEHPDEMGEQLDHAVKRLVHDESYQKAFAAAFPEEPAITEMNLVKAIASYVRTIVSPPTRFDQWLAGDRSALSDEEKAGFKIFVGRGNCVACHSGFVFTDHSFHDIGLDTDDLGRGPVLGVPQVNYAFKTPGLRELAWTAPYMHDGSLATLDDVVRHYESGGIDRPSRSKDMPVGLRFSDEERLALIAFLGTLSSDRPPSPSREPWVLGGRAEFVSAALQQEPAQAANMVSQRDKRFAPGHVSLQAGQTLTILNDDSRTHNVRIYDPRFDYNSGAQEPGESIAVTLPEAGSYIAFCGIHPTMKLKIDVD